MDLVEDRYRLTVDCDMLTYNEIRNWCYDQFGAGWGESQYIWTQPSGHNRYGFAFRRLYHAQWFMMRWQE